MGHLTALAADPETALRDVCRTPPQHQIAGVGHKQTARTTHTESRQGGHAISRLLLPLIAAVTVFAQTPGCPTSRQCSNCPMHRFNRSDSWPQRARPSSRSRSGYSKVRSSRRFCRARVRPCRRRRLIIETRHWTTGSANHYQLPAAGAESSSARAENRANTFAGAGLQPPRNRQPRSVSKSAVVRHPRLGRVRSSAMTEWDR